MSGINGVLMSGGVCAFGGMSTIAESPVAEGAPSVMVVVTNVVILVVVLTGAIVIVVLIAAIVIVVLTGSATVVMLTGAIVEVVRFVSVVVVRACSRWLPCTMVIVQGLTWSK